MLQLAVLASIGLLAVLLLLTFPALAAPEFEIESADIDFSDPIPTIGETVTITATVDNTGDVAGVDVEVTFYDGPIGGTLIDTATIADLPAGGQGDATVDWTVTSPNGTRWINVSVETQGGELITADNEADTSVEVNEPPVLEMDVDLTVKETLVNFAFVGSNSSDPDGVITSYFWGFGDGSFAFISNPQHSYDDDGDYTVTLTISDDDGGTVSGSLLVTATNRDPVASAVGQTVLTLVNVFLDASNSTDQDGFIQSVRWTFHEGTIKNGVKVQFLYPDDGSFPVTLEVTDDDGAINSTSLTITVLNRAPDAAADANRTKINASDSVHFDGTGSSDLDGVVSAFTWIFPGGAFISGSEVDYIFALSNGSYLVTLVVTDDDGAIDTISISIKVGNNPPVAVAPQALAADTNVDLILDGRNSYDPDGVLVNHTWDFADGTPRQYGSLTNHTFTDDGLYQVRLTVRDDSGASNWTEVAVSIFNVAPTAYHDNATTLTLVDVRVNGSASNDTDGTIASWSWDFYDGNPPQVTLTAADEATKAYADDGVYRVTLTVTDDDGAVGSHDFWITVDNRPPLVDFDWSWDTQLNPDSPVKGFNVTFTAIDTFDLDGTVVAHNWAFGDLTFGMGVSINHSFTIEGAYAVTLQAVDDDGGAAEVTKLVVVDRINLPPVANFSVDTAPEDLLTKSLILFNATSSMDPDGSIALFTWDFGDGTAVLQTTLPMTTHIFTSAGGYTVLLVVTDDGTALGSGALTSAAQRAVTITPRPNALPSASGTAPSSGLVEEALTFDGSASTDPDGTIVSYLWEFGDGSETDSRVASHAYATARTYSATLTVTDDDGGEDTATFSIKVSDPPPSNPPPTASFTVDPPSLVAPTFQAVRFDASASADPDGIASYTWIFGDGATGEGKTLTHTYDENGGFLVILTVIDTKGASSSTVKQLTIRNQVPQARIDGPTSVQSGLTQRFDGSNSTDLDGAIVNYQWWRSERDSSDVFSLMLTGPESATKLEFARPGVYTVRLIVTDDDGAHGEALLPVTVLNRPPQASAGVDREITVQGPQAVVALDGSASSDPDGAIVQWSWVIDDNPAETYSGVNPTVPLSATDKGTVHRIVLTVTDDKGAIATDEVQVVVRDNGQPPVVKPPKPDGNWLPGFETVAVLAALGLVAALGRRRAQRRV